MNHDVSLPPSSIRRSRWHITFRFRYKTFYRCKPVYHCPFSRQCCPEVVRQQPAEIPGGGEGVEETAISSPPEIHSGPPASPQMQHRSLLAGGRACCHCRRRCSRRMGRWNSPPSRWARRRLPCSCPTQVGKACCC